MKLTSKAIVSIILIIMSLNGLNAQSVIIKNSNGEDIRLYNNSYALIIGVSNYTNGWPLLSGVMKDVADVKELLEKQGFKVVTIIDPNHEQLVNSYRNFINQYGLEPDNRLVMYFAGHGHTVKTAYGEDMGYIVPSDAPNPNKDKNDFLIKAMAMQQIEVFAKQIQSKHALFLFDACFSGSIFAVSRAIPENITYKTAKPVRQFITSGSAEETVPDESIFKSQFVDGINGEADMNKDGFITGTELGEYLQDKVINYSKGSQHPQYGKIRNPNLDKGDFVFVASTQNNQIGVSNPSIVETENSRGNDFSKDNRASDQKSVRAGYSIIEDKDFESSIQEMPELFAKIAIQTPNGSFLCAEQGGGNEVSSVRKHIDQWETFKIVNLNDSKIALRTHKGFYLTIDDSLDILTSTSDNIIESSTFELIFLEGDNIAIKTFDGRYLCALSGGGRKIVTAPVVKEHEVFKLFKVRLYRIKTANGKFASLDDAKFTANKSESKDGLPLEIVRIDKDKIAFRSPKGLFLKITEKQSIMDSQELTEECVFIPEALTNGLMRFKSIKGKYVTAIGGGGFMFRADKTNPGDWETFELLPSTPFD